MTQFRPLLAYDASSCPLAFPLFASPKIDGIRCLVTPNGAVTRSLKPIPNHFIRRRLWGQNNPLCGLDGELVVGDSFNTSTSAIMSQEGEPDFRFWVFDCFDRPGLWFNERLVEAMARLNVAANSRAFLLKQVKIKSREELEAFEVLCLGEGYEGVMVRRPDGVYKYGRSTEKEGILGKIKRFEDREGEVVGMVPLSRNRNPATTNALGLQERGHSEEGKVEMELLGTLVVRDPKFAATFEIGTGFTAAQRAVFFREPPLGQLVKYKYLPHGTIDRPRHPVFLGLRDRKDL
jgi:DNA ligase-1